MSFTFNTAIPEANNNPSVDQPDMKINNQSTDAILNVDHISFNADNGGNHKQVHLPAYTNPAIVNGTATQGSIVYSKAGVADAAHAQGYFKNGNNLDFPMSHIRAWATADSAGNILASQSINIASIVPAGTGRFNVTLTANAVTTDTFGVLSTAFIQDKNNGAIAGYNRTGVGTFQLTFIGLGGAGFATPDYFTFQVLQI